MQILLKNLLQYTGVEIEYSEFPLVDLDVEWTQLFDLSIPQFAAKERKCKQGNFPCGGRCISGKAKRKDGTPVQCRKVLPGQAKNYALFLKAQKKVNPESTRTVKSKTPEQVLQDKITNTDLANYKQVMTLGGEFLKSIKVKLPTKKDLKEEEKLLKQKHQLFEKFSKGGVPIADLVEAENKHAAALEKREKANVEVAQSIISALIQRRGISEAQANRYSSALTIDSSIDSELHPSIREIAARYHLLTGFTGDVTFTKTEDRAYYNDSSQTINIGRLNVKGAVRPDVIFHEMSHGLEYSNNDIYASALNWAQSKAKSDIPRKINELAPNSGYTDDEIAYEDKYIDPYVGKVYSWNATEVISVGLERFASLSALGEFATQAPDHLKLILGILVKR